MTDQEQIVTLQAVIAEIERRLTLGEGYADGDRIRFALLHIEAFKAGRADVLALRDREVAALQAVIAEAYKFVADAAEVAQLLPFDFIDAAWIRGLSAILSPPAAIRDEG